MDMELTQNRGHTNQSTKSDTNHSLSVVVKRPMNAFMLWSKQKRREISNRDPRLHNAQISKLLGEEWKLLPHQEKLPYIKESQKLMLKHKEEHPDYRYKPRQNKLSKGIKSFGEYANHPHHLIAQHITYDRHNNNNSSHKKLKYAPEYESYARTYEYEEPRFFSSKRVVCKLPGCYDCFVMMKDRYYGRPSYYSGSYGMSTTTACSCCDTVGKSAQNDGLLSNYIYKKPSCFSVEAIIGNNKGLK